MQSAFCSRAWQQRVPSVAAPYRPSRVLTQHGCVGCLRTAKDASKPLCSLLRLDHRAVCPAYSVLARDAQSFTSRFGMQAAMLCSGQQWAIVRRPQRVPSSTKAIQRAENATARIPKKPVRASQRWSKGLLVPQRLLSASPAEVLLGPSLTYRACYLPSVMKQSGTFGMRLPCVAVPRPLVRVYACVRQCLAERKTPRSDVASTMGPVFAWSPPSPPACRVSLLMLQAPSCMPSRTQAEPLAQRVALP